MPLSVECRRETPTARRPMIFSKVRSEDCYTRQALSEGRAARTGGPQRLTRGRSNALRAACSLHRALNAYVLIPQEPPTWQLLQATRLTQSKPWSEAIPTSKKSGPGKIATADLSPFSVQGPVEPPVIAPTAASRVVGLVLVILAIQPANGVVVRTARSICACGLDARRTVGTDDDR